MKNSFQASLLIEASRKPGELAQNWENAEEDSPKTPYIFCYQE